MILLVYIKIEFEFYLQVSLSLLLIYVIKKHKVCLLSLCYRTKKHNNIIVFSLKKKEKLCIILNFKSVEIKHIKTFIYFYFNFLILGISSYINKYKKYKYNYNCKFTTQISFFNCLSNILEFYNQVFVNTFFC